MNKTLEANTRTETQSALASKPWDDPARFEEREIQFNCVCSSFLGIVLAGMAYPICLMAIGVFFSVVSAWSLGPQLLDAVIAITMLAMVGGLLGATVSTFTGLISIATVHLMNRSLGFPLPPRYAAISAGSMAGYIPTAWVLFAPTSTGAFDWALIGFLGPLLAMAFGAVGAAWASKKFGSFDTSLATKRQLPRNRFRIVHLMAATGWVAVTFATANYFGGLGFAIAAAGWFALQAIMMAVVHFGIAMRPTRG